MKKSLVILSVLVFSHGAMAQTTLIKNINGYTLDGKELKQFSAIAFTDDKVDQLYQRNEKLPDSPDIIEINGAGKTLIPGLIDAHGHVLSYGLSLLRADVSNTVSEQDAVKRVVAYHQQNQTLTWLQGRGWNQVQWANKTFPSAKSLDRYFPNQPVWLRRIDGHAGWANSRAMELAGITAATPTPGGGDIIRDDNNNPTGVFIDNAMSLIENAMPKLSAKEQKYALTKAMNELAGLGLTSVHDAGISVENIDAYKELAANNAMPIRVNAMLDIGDAHWLDFLKTGPYRSNDDMFVVGSVKIVADGALGSRGAALFSPYSDDPHQKGLLIYDEQQLTHAIKTAMLAGFQVNTHAIGDRANNLVITNYQQLIPSTKTQALRHRIEHAQVLQLTDIAKFKQFGIIASMQATHATSDMNMAEDRLGKERLQGAYAWRKLLDSGAIIAAGSDFPVEAPNPFFGLHAAVTRQNHENLPADGWIPEEKMTLTQAFRSFTLDAAYAGHQETIIGSLAPGKKADFVLLEQNPFIVPVSNLWKTQVLSTWVNGKTVFKIQ